MSSLRKLARGRDCMVRLPGFCDGNPETTVLAHIRMAGISGFGVKAHDVLAAWCCAGCHRVIDSPATYGMNRDAAMLAHLQGVMRTQNQLIAEGIIHVGRPSRAAA